MTAVTQDLTWVPSPLTRRLATGAVLALGAAALVHRPTLVVFAAPFLVALAVWVRETRTATAEVTVDLPTLRTTEQQAVPLETSTDGSAGIGSWRLLLRPGRFVESDGAVLVALGDRATGGWQVTPTRWGWWSAGSVVAVARSERRAWMTETSTPAPELTVYPPATSAARVPAPPHLRSRLGPHVSRVPGAGVEFAGIREYHPGDPTRRVNWLASSRGGSLVINEFAQERMADVVLLIDGVHDLGEPGETTVDRSVRGASSVAQAYLMSADRVGVVAFGSSLRWLAPTTGTRHFYRIVETLLQARQARTYVHPSIDRLPLVALPSGALVVCFSPLVDDLVVQALQALRERAHPVVVVDMLAEHGITVRSADDELALRIWRLTRAATQSSLASIGVRVVPYAEVSGGTLGWLRLGGERTPVGR